MSFLMSKNEYEELEPSPIRPNQRKMLKIVIITALTGLLLTTLLIVVLVTSTQNNPPGNLINGDNSQFILQAPGDANETSEDILVEIDQGSLRGKKLKSRGGREYLAFLGIPYAQPPVGDLRFKPPVEAEAWNGTLNATELPLQCIQKDKYNPNLVTLGKEDCLYLNIYTPKKLADLSRRRNRFPVMVYIHGGGQFGNGSRYKADYLMDEDVIFVNFNYRLGILGNLNTNDSEARGNQGQKDQVMALQWVKDNIKKFGGNSRKVTIFGNSFGAILVSTHLLSPMSKGLFHRAICESGVALFDFQMENEAPAKTAFDVGEKLNCTEDTNSTLLINCLRNMDAETLILESFLEPFYFSVEPPSENEDSFLTDTPLNLLQNGEINKVPVIFGVNSGEGLFTSLPLLINENITEVVNANWTIVANELLSFENVQVEDPDKISIAVRDFYFGDKEISRETVSNLTNIFSDRNYIHPTYTAATFQSKNSGSGRRQRRNSNNVYLYYFNREVPRKYSAKLEAVYEPESFLGASHADEIQLLFPYDDYPYINLDSEWANMSISMVKLWTSFAADGKPSGVNNTWEPIKSEEKPYKWFELTDEPKMSDPLGERMNFWDSFNLTELYSRKEPSS